MEKNAPDLRIGVIGGTFDPPHYGHLAAAQAALETFSLDKVLFVPNGYPPHKDPSELSQAAHRFAMVELAIAGLPRFQTHRMEMDRSGPHFTIDTIRLLKEEVPTATFYFIIGADMALDLPAWRNSQALLEACYVVAITRPGYDFAKLGATRGSIYSSARERLLPLAAAGVAISSTEIRNRLQQGESCRFLAPDNVLQYAFQNGLYRSCGLTADFSLAQAVRWVQTKLCRRRYEHTCRVMTTAAYLANLHGVDTHLAEMAACLHDCARDLPQRVQLKLAEASGIVLAGATLQQGALLHADAAVSLVMQELGVANAQVLAAIRSHTTGRAGMSPLEQVVFLADFIEPGRCFPGVDDVRDVASTSLDKAMLLALEMTISHVLEQGSFLHPATVLARNDLLLRLQL